MFFFPLFDCSNFSSPRVNSGSKGEEVSFPFPSFSRHSWRWAGCVPLSELKMYEKMRSEQTPFFLPFPLLSSRDFFPLAFSGESATEEREEFRARPELAFFFPFFFFLSRLRRRLGLHLFSARKLDAAFSLILFELFGFSRRSVGDNHAMVIGSPSFGLAPPPKRIAGRPSFFFFLGTAVREGFIPLEDSFFPSMGELEGGEKMKRKRLFFFFYFNR